MTDGAVDARIASPSGSVSGVCATRPRSERRTLGTTPAVAKPEREHTIRPGRSSGVAKREKVICDGSTASG